VWVYTSGDSVELFLNGKSLGVKDVAPFDKAGWSNVTFVPGNLTAVAMKRGNHWAVQTLETPGAAAEVRLGLDMPVARTSSSSTSGGGGGGGGGGDDPLRADGQDCAILTASVVDAQGRTVHASPGVEVAVAVSGAGVLLGMGNGDPTDHTAEGRTGSGSRRVFNGLVRVLVQSTTTPGDIVITATANGLKGSSITVASVPVPVPMKYMLQGQVQGS
jgi:beta-galactosidase